MQELIDQGRIGQTRAGAVPAYKRYLDEMPGVSLQDIWADVKSLSPQAKERVGYPTQKPLALLDRIIRASSNEGDMVLDPFCGCATACVAADRLDRLGPCLAEFRMVHCCDSVASPQQVERCSL